MGRPRRPRPRSGLPGPPPARLRPRPQEGHRPGGQTWTPWASAPAQAPPPAPPAYWVGEGAAVRQGSAKGRFFKAAKKRAREETNGIPTRRWAELRLRHPHANQMLSSVTPFGPMNGVTADQPVPWQRAVSIGLEPTGSLSSFPKSNLFPKALYYIYV